MRTQLQKAEAFRALHARPGTFIIPNPWDAGSAKILTSLGFEALATTSAGAAFTLGVDDGTGALTRDLALANARAIVDATDLPVNGDLENLYAHEPDVAAGTIALAAAAGLVGCSIEDATGDDANPIYPFDVAVARVKAAVAATRRLALPFLLTARAENFLHGRRDMADTIRRLQAFEAAGADVLYAPGLNSLDEIRAVLAAVTKPVNILVSTGNAHLTLADLSAAGTKRISTGGAPARAALGALIRAGREMKEHGTFSYGREAASFAEITKLFKGAST
jgi:2-methylisocitrate lyase-like PEP mutase family enzyme